jgi:hypothetical protein
MTTTPFPPPPQKTIVVKGGINEIYILMDDDSGTTFSLPTPTGEFVLTLEEAKAWVEGGKGKGWYDGRRDYRKASLKKGS